MRRRWSALVVAAVLSLALAPAALAAETFTADLSGDNSVPPLDVDGTGEATVTISDDEQTVSWDVSYSGLTGAPGAGHIHFGAVDANGPVMVPFAEVTETGTTGSFAAGDYAGGEGLPDDWDGVLDAIRDGNAYVNIHTEANPGGEIRGQLAGSGGAGATTPPTDTEVIAPAGGVAGPAVLLVVALMVGAMGVLGRVAVARRR